MEANERMFVDTNYFVALFNPFDALHRAALKTGRQIDAAGARLVISNFIFLEVVTVLAQRRGKDVAREAGEYLISNGAIETIHVDKSLNEASWQTFKYIREKNVSFVDASIIAILQGEGIRWLLTFDRADFRKLASRYHFHIYGDGE